MASGRSAGLFPVFGTAAFGSAGCECRTRASELEERERREGIVGAAARGSDGAEGRAFRVGTVVPAGMGAATAVQRVPDFIVYVNPVNGDHLGVLFWGDRPQDADKPKIDEAGWLQFMPPFGGMWDYHPRLPPHLPKVMNALTHRQPARIAPLEGN